MTLQSRFEASSGPFRYEMIDGLRGIAAAAVVAHHLGIAPVGHAAVMLFFVISGYCIAAAAESGRQRGMGFGQFMWRRARRIFPPYLFALAFFTATRVVKAVVTGSTGLSHSWLDWLQNLTLTQWLTLLQHPAADAPQNPTLFVAAFWSLNYEEQFYLVMAGVLALSLWRRMPMWPLVLALGVAGLVWNLAVPDGWVTGFFLEYWVHFSLGALLFYALCLFPTRIFRSTFVMLVLALGVYSGARLLLLPPSAPDPRVYGEFVVVCAFTLFLYFMRPLSATVSRAWLWRPVAALGTIAYSLYLVHQFNLTLVAELTRPLQPHIIEPVRQAVMLALEIALASLFWYFCERPFLNRPWKKNVTPPVGVINAPDPAHIYTR